jgi:DUF4097 and DUF4098 domain-containing protein YvlB
MRRLVFAAVVTSVTAGIVVSAHAGPGIPLNNKTEVFEPHGPVTSVVVTGDYSNIKVKPGSRIKVTATEAWNLYAPTVTVALHDGALKVTASCTRDISAGGVEINGATDQANDCFDDLALTVPSRVDLTATTSSGDVTSSEVGGAQRLHSDIGSVTVTGAGASVTATSSNGAVSVTDMHGAQLSLSSDTSNVTASDVNAPTITMYAGNGEVRLSRATSRTVKATSDTSNVIVTRLRAETLEASTGNGEVQFDHSNVLVTSAHSDTANVTVNDVVSPSISATSSNGIVSVESVTAAAIVASSDTADVQVSAISRPDAVVATSGNGAVFVGVPRGSYVIHATADSGGKVTVTGVTNNPHAKHRIEARSDTNNVTVAGH